MPVCNLPNHKIIVGPDGPYCWTCQDKELYYDVASRPPTLPKTPAGSFANCQQVGGAHYMKHGDLQHWDVVAKFDLDYFQGQITKYVMRWKDKNGLEDLKKARHFLDKYIELNTPKG